MIFFFTFLVMSRRSRVKIQITPKKFIPRHDKGLNYYVNKRQNLRYKRIFNNNDIKNRICNNIYRRTLESTDASLILSQMLMHA